MRGNKLMPQDRTSGLMEKLGSKGAMPMKKASKPVKRAGGPKPKAR